MRYQSKYKDGMTREDENLLRQLRNRGFAVAIFSPIDVGNALNRQPIEAAMVRAGKQTMKQMEVRSA